MSPSEKQQSSAKVMEWIAFAGVIAFGLGMTYAIHITSQTVNKVNENHYSAELITPSESNTSDASTSTPEN